MTGPFVDSELSLDSVLTLGFGAIGGFNLIGRCSEVSVDVNLEATEHSDCTVDSDVTEVEESAGGTSASARRSVGTTNTER